MCEMAKSYILEEAIKEVQNIFVCSYQKGYKQADFSKLYFLLGFLRSIVSFVGSASD
jgi:hypothetical protein